MQGCRRAPSGLLASIVVSAGLGGCAAYENRTGVENRWRDPGMAAFSRGETTRGDVIDRLGPPSQLINLGDGVVLYYLTEVGSASGFVSLIYNQLRVRTVFDRAIFFFDDQGLHRLCAERGAKPARRWRMKWQLALPAALMAVLAGCSVFKTEFGVDLPDEPPPFEISATSRSEVLSALGPPIRIAAMPDGSAFLYEHALANEAQLGISLSVLDLNILKALVAQGVAHREAMILTFDRGGVLNGQSYNRWTERLGTGGSIQFIFATVPVIDTSRLSEDPPAEMWSTALLRSLPETLNDPHGLVRGENGLEQLTTPAEIGQRTLELH